MKQIFNNYQTLLESLHPPLGSSIWEREIDYFETQQNLMENVYLNVQLKRSLYHFP